jgi:hypothetical protein
MVLILITGPLASRKFVYKQVGGLVPQFGELINLAIVIGMIHLTISKYHFHQPHKKYVDAALKAQSNKDKDASKSKAPDDPPVVPVAQPTSPVLNVIPSSPEMGAFSILGASAMEERNYETASPLVYDRRLSTAITIDDATRTDSLHVPIW